MNLIYGFSGNKLYNFNMFDGILFSVYLTSYYRFKSIGFKGMHSTPTLLNRTIFNNFYQNFLNFNNLMKYFVFYVKLTLLYSDI